MHNLYLISKGNFSKYTLLFIPLFFTSFLSAQIKWDGEAGDGLWMSAANWVGDVLPAAGDNVLLDNSFVTTNYIIALPGGTLSVTIRTITISPSAGASIQLILPASNTALVPAFVATGPGYGILINEGGVFQNSSGVTSGNAILIADSMRINNGGQYTHNTRAAHAALVTVLSKSPGTETGVFKFDVPGGSYTFSSANRVYGALIFSSEASGGTQFYNAIAVSPLTINSDLIVNAGVTVNLDINNDVLIKRDFIQNGGVFNIASQPNNNITSIRGDLIQNNGAITETSTGLPTIELNGTTNQHINMGGIISNSVTVRINNAAGATLLSNATLPYKLELVNGIVTTHSFLLTLLSSCTIVADSMSVKSFINGRLRKEGLSAVPGFLFPVGKDITQRWLELKNVTGNYTVEFFKGNSNLISNNIGAGIHHVSSIEYWTIEADATPAPTGNVELSFDNINSGGVSDLLSLRVARLNDNIWQDAGNTGTTGVVGVGSVISNLVSFSAINATKYFTLASNNALQNPLPLNRIDFTASRTNAGVELKWRVEIPISPLSFELQTAADGIHFLPLADFKAIMDLTSYYYTDKRRMNSRQWYRLKMVGQGGSLFYSNVIAIASFNEDILQIIPSVISGQAVLRIHSRSAAGLQIKINDVVGRMLQTIDVPIAAGNSNIPLQLNHLPAGVYWLSLTDGRNKIVTTQFIKL